MKTEQEIKDFYNECKSKSLIRAIKRFGIRQGIFIYVLQDMGEFILGWVLNEEQTND